MGEIRKFTSHKKWTDAEVSILFSLYETASHQLLLSELPGITISQIQNKGYLLGLRRYKPPKISDDERRERKRQHMARKRAADPAAVRKYHRERHHKNPEKNRKKMREYYGRRFFWGRAMKLKGNAKANYQQLAFLWKRQRGLCALTGRQLTREAQLDHILPKARGGDDSIGNLRWVCKEANIAKRHLTDDEFLFLCSDVMYWIGKRIDLFNKRQS